MSSDVTIAKLMSAMR